MRHTLRYRRHRPAASGKTPAHNDASIADASLLAGSVNTVHLKHRLRDVEADRRNRLHSWLLRIVGALAAPTSMALACRWRSRPQHQKPTFALQQFSFDHLVGATDAINSAAGRT